MSLILDALKQADSERARGGVPGVFSHPAATAEPPARARGRRPLAWLLAAALAGGCLWFAWPHLNRSARPVPASPTAAVTPAATPSPQIVPPQAPPQVPPQAPPPGSALFRTEAVVAAPPANPAPAPVAASPITEPPNGYPTPLAPARPPAQASAVLPPGADELPADVRSRLPSVQITGHTYSDNPTLRMLMIDGHMVVEGQSVAPGLRLERIGPHQAIFNHRGTRYSVPY
jgi:general secretion pathway protein B